MPDYSKQIAHAISVMTKRSAHAMSMLSPTNSAKRSQSVREILDIRYDIACDVTEMSEETNFLWAENCGAPLTKKRD